MKFVGSFEVYFTSSSGLSVKLNQTWVSKKLTPKNSKINTRLYFCLFLENPGIFSGDSPYSSINILIDLFSSLCPSSKKGSVSLNCQLKNVWKIVTLILGTVEPLLCIHICIHLYMIKIWLQFQTRDSLKQNVSISP